MENDNKWFEWDCQWPVWIRKRWKQKARSFRQQTDRVGGPWAHLQCMLPCISTTAILQEKDGEKENLDRWKSSIRPSIIHWWIRSRLNEVEEREGGGEREQYRVVWKRRGLDSKCCGVGKGEEFRWGCGSSRDGILRFCAFYRVWEDKNSAGPNAVLAKWGKGIYSVEKRGQIKGRGGRGYGASIGEMMMMCLCFFWEGLGEGEVSDAQRSWGHLGPLSALEYSYKAF